MKIEAQANRVAVDELRKASFLPDGKTIKTRARGWHHQIVYLADDPLAIVSERAVPVPSRLIKAHPVAQAYRDDSDHHEVSARQLSRATRIVHALAIALGEAGGELKPGRRTPDGQLVARRNGWDVPLRISEKSAPGGAEILHYNLRRGRPLPSWQARRQKEFIPTGRLTILIGGQYGGREGRQCRFSDTKAHCLEDLLPGVVREIEMRFFERRQDEIEVEREDQEQEQRWQRVLVDARQRAAEAFRADILAKRASTWRQWHEQVAYVDALHGLLPQLAEEERTATEEWLTWSRRHLTGTDPSQKGHGLPRAPEPTREFLEPYIRGWIGPFRAFPA